MENILEEANRLTTRAPGTRQDDYDHPIVDFTRTTGMVNAMLAHKLKVPLAPEDFAMIMVCCKLSRQQAKPKRDNLVDAAGYLRTVELVQEARR